MSGVEVVTFGCRLNASESEAMAVLARRAGAQETVVVNTCAVTSEAVRQARQEIRRLKRARPGGRVIVTGCAAQLDPGGFAAMAEVDLVLGNAEKLDERHYAPAAPAAPAAPDAPEVRHGAQVRVGAMSAAPLPPPVPGRSGRARALVQVQNGCDHRCTFCIIPHARGPARSVPAAEVVARVREQVAAGHKEAVLTGVDLTAWGADLAARPRLGDLVRRILREAPDLRRLRLSSLDPAEVDAALERAWAEEERLMPHAHLSLQAGDDMVLKRMKRRHTRADAERFCARMRRLRPDITFGADLIAGFPTETDAMFANTLSVVSSCDLAWLHVFPFSPRPGTPAARMPQVPAALRRQRAARLRERGRAQRAVFLQSQQQTQQQVLMETATRGRTAHNAPLRLGSPAAPGEIVAAQVTGLDGEGLCGVRLHGAAA